MKFDNARAETQKAIAEIATEAGKLATGVLFIYGNKWADKLFTWLEAKFN